MASFEKTDPQAPRLPELLEETRLIRSGTRMRHVNCNLLFRRVEQGIAISVAPVDEPSFNRGFDICVEERNAMAGIFFDAGTDFEASLAGGIGVRPDRLNKRMLTELGKEKVIQALRFGVFGAPDA